MSVEEKASLVFIPFPMLSHLAATVTAAKLLSERDERLAVTVLIMKFPAETKITSYINNFPQSQINFIHLEENQPTSEEKAASESPSHGVFQFIESQKKAVTDAVSEIIESRKLKRISGFVIDMLCFSMTDVANDFGAPTYVFFTCSAASVGFMVDLQNLKDDHDQDLTVYDESDFEISVSTFVNPVPAKVWPASTFIKGRVFPDPFIARFKEIKGIMVNTFLEFEHHTIRSVTGNQNIPPIYTVGPILGDDRDEVDNDDILGWLDEQPDSSVVFLCFGSLGFFEKEQVKEIAKALEQSKQRFLWSLRKPPSKETENANELLPEGFVGRIEGMGRVIEWAPQKAVLAHPAVGGFVSHCGWNSILESVWFGVPIATFPLFAEQQMNAFQLVKEFGMAEMIRIDYHKDMMGVKTPEIVGAEEIVAAIRRLMDKEGGSGVMEKVKEMQKKARSALVEGGSSYNAMGLFIEDVIHSGRQ